MVLSFFKVGRNLRASKSEIKIAPDNLLLNEPVLVFDFS